MFENCYYITIFFFGNGRFKLTHGIENFMSYDGYGNYRVLNDGKNIKIEARMNITAVF